MKLEKSKTRGPMSYFYCSRILNSASIQCAKLFKRFKDILRVQGFY